MRNAAKEKSNFFLIVSCLEEGNHSRCYFSCHLASARLGIGISKVARLFNVSITAYQYLICPEKTYGPGCEQKCECSERETCHFIKGCHIGT